MNILVIEPSKTSQTILETIFKAYATNIFITGSGAEAKGIYNLIPIDLICLSFYLIDMEGIQFINNIRNTELGETIPILMITSKKSQNVIVKSLTDGATEVFLKDDLKELEIYLKKYAEHTRQQAQIEGNILLIDNDIQQANEIKTYFNNTRLKFIHFTKAEEATEMAQAAEFDLVITNVVLGGSMSGISLIRKIREINNTMYRVPILAISAITNVSQKIELFRAGLNDFIEKPVLLEELSVRMKNLLQNKKLFDTVELQKKQLENLACRDQLTGLYNRHYFLGSVASHLNDSIRHNYPISLLVIDLDHFKEINDTYGHPTGDIVLKAVADLLLRKFRGSDVPVRYGGEEFIILLPHCNRTDAASRAETLRSQIEALRPSSIEVTASIGVAHTFPNVDCSFKELFAVADRAVYEAKANGRNCIIVHEL